MPAIKHPCPHCGAWIQRDVAACPACGRRDPFTPGRCENCRRVIENPAWVACPGCGAPLGAAASSPTPARQPAEPERQAPAPAASNPGQPPAATACTGCGAPLSAGARFCTVCGTLAS